MNAWVQVDKLKDAEPVNAKTLNRPVDQLASRTDYLKKRLGTIIDDGVQSSLVLTDVDLLQEEGSASETFQVGNIVYRSGTGFRKAQAKMHLYDDFTADESAFTIGILINVNGSIGDVLIYGKLDLSSGSLISKKNLLQDGETFRSGRYYLSANEPGKITSKPNGPLVYVGSFHADSSGALSIAYVNPQFLDMGTSHVHRSYSLVARPAGTLDGKDVIGYLPIGASEGSSSSDSESSFEPSTRYPSLVFGGTWTSDSDISYTFTLDAGSAWGSVGLKWYKNGNASKYKHVEIPAPGVFVELDNGLKVKVIFPEATNAHAFTSLSESERTWNLSFPYAGRGWVNHSVEAIASIHDSDTSGESSGEGIEPVLHAVLSGAWPDNDNEVGILFPEVAYDKTITDSTSVITIGGTKYQFVQEGQSPSSGNVGVIKGATAEESVHNLASTINASIDMPSAFAYGSKILTSGLTITGYTKKYTGTTTGFKIVGGTIPLMLVYDKEQYLIGDPVTNHPTYVPAEVSGIEVSLYAEKATDTNNYTCLPGTRLSASAYDYAPDAIYDYVMGLHQEVDYYYPPVPAQAAGLFVNGVEVESSALFPLNPTYTIGRKTLYWMEDEEGKLPWPSTIKGHDDPVDARLDKTMAFYFVVGFQCSTGPVTSLVSAPGSAVKLYTYGTNDRAATGDLMIDAALDFSVSDAGIAGYNVAKQGKGGKMLAGPVVERIKAGSGIVVTQEAGCPIGQGTVTIGLNDGTLRGQFNEIALENAKQEKIGLFPYVSLLGWGSSSNIPSAFTAMMRIPSNLDVEKDYQVHLRMVMFGAIGYENEARLRAAGIQLEYNILPDYTDRTNLSLKTGLLVPDNPRSICVPIGHQNGQTWEYKAFDPFVATTEITQSESIADVIVPFSSLPLPSEQEFSSKTPEPTLKPGYLLAIRVSRITMPDTVSYAAYTGPVGFLTTEWTIEEA